MFLSPPEKGVSHMRPVRAACFMFLSLSRERQTRRDKGRERKANLAVRLGLRLCYDVRLMFETVSRHRRGVTCGLPSQSPFLSGAKRRTWFTLHYVHHVLSILAGEDGPRRVAEMLATCFLNGSHTTSLIGPFFRRAMERQRCYEVQARITKERLIDQRHAVICSVRVHVHVHAELMDWYVRACVYAHRNEVFCTPVSLW